MIGRNELAEAISSLPPYLQLAVEKIAADDSQSEGMAAMLERGRDFPSMAAAMLAGVFSNPDSRQSFNAAIDERTAADGSAGISNRRLSDECIIGGGIHAAIYAAVRVSLGYPPPVVLERGDTCGGIFNVSRGPSFYLNSRNRPGILGLPGTNDALNVLPAAIVQPSDLGGDEYQTNDALAFAVRATLAANARVLTGITVAAVNTTSNGPVVDTAGFGSARFRRVIIATGLSRTAPISQPTKDERVMSFADFMQRMDRTFPLRGMTRVAVIGAGDSGRTCVEGLIGQGPSSGLSVASIDRPSLIDWYGQTATDKATFESRERPRYRRIGSFLPSTTADRQALIRPRVERAVSIAALFDRVEVNGRAYDAVIDASGYRVALPTLNDSALSDYRVNGATVATNYGSVFVVGPAARIAVSDSELANDALRRIGENSAAIFRYAYRTAALASVLDSKENN